MREIARPVLFGATALAAVALALHELATNSAKYGALTQASGRLSVTWRVEGDDGAGRLVIDWRESGVAMPDGGTPARRGYGTELIQEALAYALEADVEQHGAYYGVVCNAGLTRDGAFPALTDEDFGRIEDALRPAAKAAAAAAPAEA